MNIKQLKVLRKEDRCAVYHVMQYLAEQGLEVTIGGSAPAGDREYKEVRLFATGDEEKLYATLEGFAGKRKPTRFSADVNNFQKNHGAQTYQVSCGEIFVGEGRQDYRCFILRADFSKTVNPSLAITVILANKDQRHFEILGYHPDPLYSESTDEDWSGDYCSMRGIERVLRGGAETEERRWR